MWLPVVVFVCLRAMGPAGIVLALTLTIVTAWFLRRRLRQQARTRLAKIKRRLPFFLDLLTLLMETRSLTLDQLAQQKYRLRDAIAVRINQHRQAHAKSAYQRQLYGADASHVEVDPTFCFHFEAGSTRQTRCTRAGTSSKSTCFRRWAN